MTNENVPTVDDLRAELARHMIPIYKIAPLVDQHPARLGQMLRGAQPMPDELALRLQQAIRDLTAKQ